MGKGAGKKEVSMLCCGRCCMKEGGIELMKGATGGAQEVGSENLLL